MKEKSITCGTWGNILEDFKKNVKDPALNEFKTIILKNLIINRY